jgi:hypothetical protein
VSLEVEVQRSYALVMEVETHDLMIPYRCLCRCLVSAGDNSISGSLDMSDSDCFEERAFSLCSPRLRVGCSEPVHARKNPWTSQTGHRYSGRQFCSRRDRYEIARLFRRETFLNVSCETSCGLFKN